MNEHTADLVGFDAYPAETPQAINDAQQHAPGHDQLAAPERDPEVYRWAMTASTMIAHKDADHGLLLEMLQHGTFERPYAYGTLTLLSRWDAVYDIDRTNMAFHVIEKRLKKYSKEHGWNYKGVVDDDGMPFSGESVKTSGLNGELPQGLEITVEDRSGSDEFPSDSPAGNKTDAFYYAALNGVRVGLLRVVNKPVSSYGPSRLVKDTNTEIHYVNVEPEFRRTGIAAALYERARQDFPDLKHSALLTGDGKAWSEHVGAHPLPGGTFICPEHGEIPSEKVLDDEQGFTCRACGQQVRSQRRANSLGEDSNGIKDWRNKEWSEDSLEAPYHGYSDPSDEGSMTAPHVCPDCQLPMPDREGLRQHMLDEHINPKREPSTSPTPVVDYDDVLPWKYHDNNTVPQRAAALDRIYQKQSKPTVQIAGPMLDELPVMAVPGERVLIREGYTVREYEWRDE